MRTSSRILMGVLAVAFLTSAGCGVSTKVRREETLSATEHRRVKTKYTGPKRRIGVVDFENKTRYGKNRLGSAASDILITELTKTNKFVVVERDKLNRILEEQKLQASGAINPRTAVKVGKILGLNAIVTGSISEFGVKTEGMDILISRSKKQIAEAVVDIRVVDVETGQVLWGASGTGKAKTTKREVMGLGGRGGYDETIEGKALRAAIVQFTDNIVNQVNLRPWSCRIAGVRGEQVYLNAGPMMGVEKGLELDCFHLGKEIIDPTTGRVLGNEEVALGRVKVTGPLGDTGDASVAKFIRKLGPRASRKDICRIAD